MVRLILISLMAMALSAETAMTMGNMEFSNSQSSVTVGNARFTTNRVNGGPADTSTIDLTYKGPYYKNARVKTRKRYRPRTIYVPVYVRSRRWR